MSTGGDNYTEVPRSGINFLKTPTLWYICQEEILYDVVPGQIQTLVQSDAALAQEGHGNCIEHKKRLTTNTTKWHLNNLRINGAGYQQFPEISITLKVKAICRFLNR